MSIPASGLIHRARAGLTLVELLAALLAASVLALTMGSLLWYASLGWRRTSEAVNLQRDMRVSMDTLTRMTRHATNFAFSTGLVYTARYSGHSPASVYASGGSLYFDPNTATAGNTVTLSSGTVVRFSVAVATNMATVVLALQRTDTLISNRVVMYRRN